jgi:hypothetical protein
VGSWALVREEGDVIQCLDVFRKQYVGKGNTAEDAAAADFSIVWRIRSLFLLTRLLQDVSRCDMYIHWAVWPDALPDMPLY